MNSNPQAQVDFAALYQRLAEAEARLSRPLDELSRAELLARRAERVGRATDQRKPEVLPVLGFNVASERYAVRMGEVEQVFPARQIWPLAGTPRRVLGAAMVRARIVPVLDLRQLLGRGVANASDLTAVVAVRSGGEPFALAVEEVHGRMELLQESLGAPPPGPYLHVDAERRAVLDLGKLLEQISRES